jgi:hypothetical protein
MVEAKYFQVGLIDKDQMQDACQPHNRRMFAPFWTTFAACYSTRTL